MAIPLTSILKTSSNELAKLRNGKVGVGDDSKAGRDKSELDGGEIDSGEVGEDEVRKKFQKTSESKNLTKSKKLSKPKKALKSDFFTSRARLAFTKLRQTFFKTPILYHFDLKCHIWIETDVSGYAISGVLSQLIFNDSGW